MKIIVAIKQVPDRDAQVRIDSSAKWIEESDLQFALNESDAYALEEALQLKEKHGGEVVVLSAGPERIGQTIREALAKGADRAINIACDDLATRDALSVARLLAAAAKQESPDLVLTGLRVKRELEDGWFQHVDMPLPALLTIQSGGNKLRYATLMGIKRAKSKPTTTISAAASTAPPAIELARVYLPEKQKKTEMLKGSATEIANQIIEKLKFEVRVL